MERRSLVIVERAEANVAGTSFLEGDEFRYHIKNLQTNRDSISFNSTLSRLVCILFFNTLWAKMDSNHRSRKTADLQSAPFGHSGICPKFLSLFQKTHLRLPYLFTTPIQRWSLLSDSNQRPRDYKSRALAN